MSKGYIIGGGGSTKMFAVIGVTYPAGSTCTCTNGTKTLKAKDTSGTAIFNVPSTGTWTVTATNGDKTASKSVSITAEGQTENVTLTYAYLSVFKEGTGAVQTLTKLKQSASSISVGSTGISFSYSSSDNAGVMAVTTAAIDLSTHSTLHVEAKITEIITVYPTWQMHFGVFSQKTIENDPSVVALAYVKPKANSTRTEYTVDVSSLTSSGYVGLYGVGAGTVYNIWLD